MGRGGGEWGSPPPARVGAGPSRGTPPKSGRLRAYHNNFRGRSRPHPGGEGSACLHPPPRKGNSWWPQKYGKAMGVGPPPPYVGFRGFPYSPNGGRGLPLWSRSSVEDPPQPPQPNPYRNMPRVNQDQPPRQVGGSDPPCSRRGKGGKTGTPTHKATHSLPRVGGKKPDSRTHFQKSRLWFCIRITQMAQRGWIPSV